MTSAIRLIINADDLGAAHGTDRGIFHAFTEGVVGSASLLANGASFTAAADRARELQLPVGVHLNLAEGRALTGAIAGLTDAAGCFPGKDPLRTLLQAGPLADGEAVRRELIAQVERVLAAGLIPDHLDSHQHCFLFPVLTAMVLDVARQCGLRALRLPVPAEAPDGPIPEPLAAELALYRQLAPAASTTLRTSGLHAPDGLFGMSLLNRLTEDSLGALLCTIPPGTWELMVHPGQVDPTHPFAGPERQRELAALTSPGIRELLARRNIKLITFGDLSCAS